MDSQVLFSRALGLLTYRRQVMRHVHFVVCVTLLFFFARIATAQVQPGLPNFSAVDSHEIDTVNLMNNNVLLNFPIMSKPGLVPVNITFVGNYYVAATASWAPSVSFINGSQPTVLVDGVIENFLTAPASSMPGIACSNGIGTTTKYWNWFVQTGDGATHWLGYNLYTDRTSSGTSCLTGSGFTISPYDSTPLTVVAGPNSNGFPNDVNTYSSSGHNLTATQIVDPNGNSIGGSTYLNDSMGLRVATITTLSGGTVAWNDVAGGTPTATFSTSSLTLKSNFACTSPSIGDYSNSSASNLVTKLSYPDGSYVSIGYETTPGNSPKVTGRLGQLTLREGGTVSYTYGGTNNGISCTYQTVPTLTRTLGNGDTTTYTLAYSLIGGSNYKAVNTVIDPGENETDYTFTGFTSGGYSSIYGQVVTQVKRYQGSCASSCTLLTTDLYSYNTAFTSTPASSIATSQVTFPITKRIVYHQINGMSNWSAAEEHFDSYGNVTYNASYDFGGASPVRATTIIYGSCTANCTTTTPTISNATLAAKYIFNRPGEVVTAQNGTNVAQANYTYSATGNLMSKQVWTGSAFIGQTTANVINSNGTPSKTYDSANNETDYTYDSTQYSDVNGCSGMSQTPFPTKITNVGTGLSISATYDCVGGVKLTDVDANGNATTYGYKANGTGSADPFWRLSSTADPYSATYYKTYGSTWESDYLIFNSNNSTINPVTNFDGYGRLINSQRQSSPTSGSYDTASTSYDWNGNYFERKITEACNTTLSALCSTVAHTLRYDPLGRLITSVTTSNETLTHTYLKNDDLAVLTPAPLGETSTGKQVQTEYDGLGRVSKVCHIGSTASTGSGTACGQNSGAASGATDSYTYGQGTGYTTVAITRGSQTRTFTYDALGRMTKKQTPEGGTVVYVFDSGAGCPGTYNGSLIAIAYSRNGSCFTYDSLGRKISEKSFIHWPTYSACRWFYYDSSTGYSGTIPTGVSVSNNLGRLVEAATDDCSGHLATDEWFAYDKDGRVLNQWQSSPHSTQYYQSTATFFDNGAINTLTLAAPSLYTMTFTIDGEGRPSTAKAGANTMVYSTTFNASSQPTAVNLIAASSDNDAYTYDANTGRMTGYTFTVGATPKSLAANLTWNPNGTLSSVATTDGFNSGGSLNCVSNSTGSLGYGYDDWGRLVTFDCGSGNWGQNYTYDTYDNLSKAQIAGRTGTNWAPGYFPSTNQFMGGSFDSNGQTTADGSGSNYWGWNEFSKMAWWYSSSIAPTCGTNGKCMTYDAFGRAVETSVTTTWKELWYTQAGVLNMSGTTANYAYWPTAIGTVFVTGNNGTDYYMHKDWLGNARISSNHGRSVVVDQAYTPYGEIFANFGSTNSYYDVFAGIPGNFNNGIQWDTPNRELGIFGRWLSPDPAGQGGQWNRYAYPLNPNSFTDPSGLYIRVCAWDGGCPPCYMCGGTGGSGGAGGGGYGGQGGPDVIYSGPLWANEAASEAAWLGSGSIPWIQNAVLGPNGLTITFKIAFWVAFRGSCAEDVFCLGRLVDNLFEFLDTGETKSFSFDTSFDNTVGAFKNSGFVEHWQDYLDHWHPGQLDLRDKSVVCSAHADIDKNSGRQAGQPTTGTIHLDTINPWEPWYFQMPIEHLGVSKIESKPCS